MDIAKFKIKPAFLQLGSERGVNPRGQGGCFLNGWARAAQVSGEPSQLFS